MLQMSVLCTLKHCRHEAHASLAKPLIAVSGPCRWCLEPCSAQHEAGTAIAANGWSASPLPSRGTLFPLAHSALRLLCRIPPPPPAHGDDFYSGSARGCKGFAAFSGFCSILRHKLAGMWKHLPIPQLILIVDAPGAQNQAKQVPV